MAIGQTGFVHVMILSSGKQNIKIALYSTSAFSEWPLKEAQFCIMTVEGDEVETSWLQASAAGTYPGQAYLVWL